MSEPRVRVYDESGEPHDIVARTKSGKVLTEEDLQALADEAERGYRLLVKHPNASGRPASLGVFCCLDCAMYMADCIFERVGCWSPHGVRTGPPRYWLSGSYTEHGEFELGIVEGRDWRPPC